MTNSSADPLGGDAAAAGAQHAVATATAPSSAAADQRVTIPPYVIFVLAPGH
jgi:hypothetical protein